MNTEVVEAITTMQACGRLGISYITLRKWMKKLNIHSHRHQHDLRLYMLYLPDVERIAEARKSVARILAA